MHFIIKYKNIHQKTLATQQYVQKVIQHIEISGEGVLLFAHYFDGTKDHYIALCLSVMFCGVFEKALTQIRK